MQEFCVRKILASLITDIDNSCCIGIKCSPLPPCSTSGESLKSCEEPSRKGCSFRRCIWTAGAPHEKVVPITIGSIGDPMNTVTRYLAGGRTNWLRQIEWWFYDDRGCPVSIDLPDGTERIIYASARDLPFGWFVSSLCNFEQFPILATLINVLHYFQCIYNISISFLTSPRSPTNVSLRTNLLVDSHIKFRRDNVLSTFF